MKNNKNHNVHLVFIMVMLLISGIIVQLPPYKHAVSSDESSTNNGDIAQRVQSLAYTGDVQAIAQGLSRYFVGSLDVAIKELLAMEHTSLSAHDKEIVLLSMVDILRNRSDDQRLVCSALLAYHTRVSREPLLYTAITSGMPVTVKDIIRVIAQTQGQLSDDFVYKACDYAVDSDDIKSLEKLYMYGIMPSPTQASHLLKRVICENRTVALAQFFIERTHADVNYTDLDNKSLVAHAIAHNNKGIISTLMRENSAKPTIS
jgi:hypothetical protein